MNKLYFVVQLNESKHKSMKERSTLLPMNALTKEADKTSSDTSDALLLTEFYIHRI